MDFIAILAEQKIRAAIQEGQFDRLPGFGKPLELEDESSIPPTLRLGYKILRNAGVLPEEMRLKKEIAAIREALQRTEDPDRRLALARDLAAIETRYNLLLERMRARRSHL